MSTERDARESASAGRVFRQRLWGAAVLVALAVIVLPLLLDGSGSESRFRELEAMREAPPSMQTDGRQGTEPESASEPVSESVSEPVSEPGQGDAEPGLAGAQPAAEAPTAWIVQAGSFRQHDNAVSLRDRLRREGFASFVNQEEAGNGAFRVNVGPMISRERADQARRQVDALLGRESFVGQYP